MLSIGYIAQQVINGFILGSMYALVAIGFSLIYSILRLINFAHGDIVMIGAFVTLGLVTSGVVPFPGIILIVLLTGLILGVTIERIAFRPVRHAPQVTGFITSLALSILFQNLGILILTAQPRNFLLPKYLQVIVEIGPISFRAIDVAIVLLSLILMLTLYVIVQRTRLGMAMRATAEKLEVARLMGINTNRVIMFAFAIGSGLAALAGLMWGGKYGQIDPLLGFIPGLKAFVAAVIGGIGSIPGAMLGGYLLGLGEILFVGLLPPAYSGYRDAFVFGSLILILLVLPQGLLGQQTEERA